MQRIQCTAPLNIVKNLQTEQICKLKCSYQFTYAPSTLQIINYGSYLYIGVDDVAVPPVIYNDENYMVLVVVLVTPSRHAYNGNTADAELIIMHRSTQNKFLNVCVPIKASSTSTADSANFFDMILNEVSQTAASPGSRTIYNNSTFTLNKFVPMAPYFSYTGTSMFETECHSRNGTPTYVADYIVFHIDNAITMTPSALATLRKVLPAIPPFGAAVEQSDNISGVFFNPDGPKSPSQGDIYIDCRPTGDEGEVLVQAKPDSSSLLDGIDLNQMWSFAIVKIIIGLVLIVVLYKLMLRTVDAITASEVKMKGGGGRLH